MKIKSLELRARVVVDGFMAGIHRSPWHGFSVEFTDYRQYSPGDDVRYLDWKLFARQDRYYIKRFEDETNLRCYLVADLSRSMEFGTTGYTKAEYSRTTLATLGYFLSLQRDAVGLLTFDESIGEYLPPRYRPGHLRRLMLGLDRATSGRRTDIEPPLEQITRLATRRGLVVLASDMLAPVEGLGRQLGYLRSQGHEVIVMRVLDPAELAFDFEDPKIFEDMESGRRLFVDPEAIRRTYLQNFQQHAAALDEICRQEGVDLLTLMTNKPLDEALLEFVRLRSQYRVRGQRRSGAGSGWSRTGGRP
ncbi:MAG: DUF58 domain-containing protein [Pirellulaceae bacterium]